MCMCVCVCVCCAQSYLTLCNPMDCSLPGSSVHGILYGKLRRWEAGPTGEAPGPAAEHLACFP